MKLLFCPHCHDVRKLLTYADVAPGMHQSRTWCSCGQSWGRYVDDTNAVYGGDAVMLGFSNSSLAQAITDNARAGGVLKEFRIGGDGNLHGRTFTAFIIPESAPTVRKEKT